MCLAMYGQRRVIATTLCVPVVFNSILDLKLYLSLIK